MLMMFTLQARGHTTGHSMKEYEFTEWYIRYGGLPPNAWQKDTRGSFSSTFLCFVVTVAIMWNIMWNQHGQEMPGAARVLS